jgi:hypothetical protein
MTWHWILTLSWASPRGQAINTSTGTIGPDQAAALGTRSAAFRAVVDAICQEAVPDGVIATVLFFCLEPDSLAAPAAAPSLPARSCSADRRPDHGR